MSRKYFPKQVKEIINFVFQNQFGVKKIKREHYRYIKDSWTKLFPKWTRSGLIKEFIELSEPDAYQTLIQLCRNAILAYPPPELNGTKQASLKLFKIASDLRQKNDQEK